MNKNGETTPLSSRLRRISGTSRILERLKNRKQKSPFHARRSQFGSKKNRSRRRGEDQIRTWNRTKRQTRKQKQKQNNERFSNLKKQLRRSQVARANDQVIRNQMFHTKVFETPIGENSDCILVEQVTEVILVDDEDEKSKIVPEENSIRSLESSKDTSPMKGTFLSYISPDKNTITDTTIKSEDSVKEIVDPENKVFNEDCTMVVQENINEAEPLEILSLCSDTSSEESSDEDSQESDSSEEESDHDSGSERNVNEVKEKPLFFEDNTGNVHIPPSEVPMYKSSFDKSDIFNSTQPHGDDVVFISSTPLEAKPRKKRKKLNRDDSVIFVSEEPAQQDIKCYDFIPLNMHSDYTNGKQPLRMRELKASNGPPSKKKRKNDVVTPKNMKPVGNSEILTASERKKNEIYNTNTYNPNREDLPRGKRMVIIDGSNVAYGHACGNQFSVKGIQIAIEYFEKIGHEVKAVVPQKRLQKSFSSDPDLLEKLHKQGKVVFTPCKHLPGKSSTSYDDRFILQLAVEFDAAIVSNDNYRDLIHENPAFKKIIESRVIGYTWCNDLFMLPKDPYGRNGPGLSVILNRV